MKKILAMALSLILVLGVLAGCGQTQEPAADPTEAPAADPTEAPAADPTEAPAEEEPAETFVFKQGFDLDYPPYSYLKDDGSIGGFDVEVCQAVCEYLGWGYEAVPFNWDAKDAELAAGSCDCIWSGFTVEGREDDYLWSDPYSNNTQLILTTEDSGIKTLADLTGKIVGVQTATSAYDLLQDAEADLCATFASLEVYETYTIAFADLQAGAIDAIAIDATAGGYLISGLEGYKFLGEDLGTETYAIGFRLEDVELRDQVNEALKALAADGTIDAIAANDDYADIRDFLCVGD